MMIRKMISVLALTIAIAVLGVAVNAQEKQAEPKSDSIEKKEGAERRMGRRGFHNKHKGFHGKRGFRRGMGFRSGMQGLRRIELTEAQKTQIKSLSETQRAAFQPQIEEMKGLMMKKRDGTITDSDKARLDQLREGMRSSAEQHKLQILSLLTAEQIQTLENMKAEHRRKMQERRQLRQEMRKQYREQSSTEKPPEKENQE